MGRYADVIALISHHTLSLATQCTVAEGFLSWSLSFSKLLPYAKYRKVWLLSMLLLVSVRRKIRTRSVEVSKIMTSQRRATMTEVRSQSVPQLSVEELRAELREHR